jgi:hypothetical protein
MLLFANHEFDRFLSRGCTRCAPTKERKRFIEAYVAGRIPTATLLDEAWKACQEEEKDALRTGIIKQASGPEDKPSAGPDLDSLSDTEIGIFTIQVYVRSLPTRTNAR